MGADGWQWVKTTNDMVRTVHDGRGCPIIGADQGCHADVFRRTDGRTSGRSDDGRGGVRDLDAL
jgi:hypothetical protein